MVKYLLAESFMNLKRKEKFTIPFSRKILPKKKRNYFNNLTNFLKKCGASDLGGTAALTTARGVYLSCVSGYITVTESICERSSFCPSGAVEVETGSKRMVSMFCTSFFGFIPVRRYQVLRSFMTAWMIENGSW